MTEFSYGSGETLALDEDKLLIFAGKSAEYENFLPVASMKVYKIYPYVNQLIKCPAPNCNYYEIFDSGQKNVVEQSVFVSICRRVSESNYVYDKCEVGKLVVGVKNG